MAVSETWLREILAQELEKAEGLPPGAAEKIANVRSGYIGPGLRAALNAMRRVIEEGRSE